MIRSIGIISVLFLMSFPVYSGCKKGASALSTKDSVPAGPRIITFAGYEWEVRSSLPEKQGPGPNYFSDAEENVWVDNEGKLHLRVTHQNGKWYCAGITLTKSYHYGRYIFQTDSRVDSLDKNVVGGLFIYKNDEQEVDVEFSKWSKEENQDAQFVVQPGDQNGNKERFPLDLDGKTSTHWFNWQQDRIEFASFRGALKDTALAGNSIHKWVYTGSSIPPDTDEKVKINLWLFKGVPPADLKEAEMVLSGFRILE